MAALMAAKRSIALSKVFQNHLSSPARPLAASGSVIARLFRTTAQMREPADDRDLGFDRRSGYRAVSRRRDDEFPAQLSVSQQINMIESMSDGPFPSSGGYGTRGRTKEENVKVSAEQGTLFIRGEGEAEPGDVESYRPPEEDRSGAGEQQVGRYQGGDVEWGAKGYCEVTKDVFNSNID